MNLRNIGNEVEVLENLRNIGSEVEGLENDTCKKILSLDEPYVCVEYNMIEVRLRWYLDQVVNL